MALFYSVVKIVGGGWGSKNRTINITQDPLIDLYKISHMHHRSIYKNDPLIEIDSDSLEGGFKSNLK